MTGVRAPIIARVLARLQIGSGCWEWPGSTTGFGYGTVHWEQPGNSIRVVHRVMYEAFYGTVPEGLDLDHLCRNRLCARPSHLEAVTRKENCARSPLLGRWSRAARKN